ncbi:hypothetical protein T11_9749, partial [Trichinella zimbabwensis]
MSEMNTDSYLASITCNSDESDSLKLMPTLPSLQLMTTDSVSEDNSVNSTKVMVSIPCLKIAILIHYKTIFRTF